MKRINVWQSQWYLYKLKERLFKRFNVHVHIIQLKVCLQQRYIKPRMLKIWTIQWNPFKTDITVTKDFILYSKVPLAQGLVVDHAPPTIVANHDKTRLLTMRKTVIIKATYTHTVSIAL